MASADFAITAYIAAAVLSAAAGYFDPRGPHTILTDALPSALAAVGLPLVGLRQQTQVTIKPSPTWIITGTISAIVFIAMLGPGISF
jgi:hypothetical protein